MLNTDNINKKIKNGYDIYAKLNKIFSKIHEAESKTSTKRIESFESLFQIREQDNEGLGKIFDKFRESMKKFEIEREKHLKTLTELIIPITEVYPLELKKQKTILEDYLTQCKTDQKMNISSELKNRKQGIYEKKFLEFENNRIKDNKYLLMHYILSELRYHSATLEKLGDLYFEITKIEPFASLKKFGENYEIKNFDFSKLRIDMEKIEEKEKEKKEKEEEEKDEVFEDDEDEGDKTSLKESRDKSKLKKSSIKKSKSKSKSKISSITENEKESEGASKKEKTQINEDI